MAAPISYNYSPQLTDGAAFPMSARHILLKILAQNLSLQINHYRDPFSIEISYRNTINNPERTYLQYTYRLPVTNASEMSNLYALSSIYGNSILHYPGQKEFTTDLSAYVTLRPLFSSICKLLWTAISPWLNQIQFRVCFATHCHTNAKFCK